LFEQFGEFLREAGFENGPLRRATVIGGPADHDLLFVQIVDCETGFGLAVARLADAAHIHQVTPPFLQFYFRKRRAVQVSVFIFDNEWLVRMADETDSLLEVAEIDARVAHRNDVVPLAWVLGRGVDVADVVFFVDADKRQFAQKPLVFRSEDLFRPQNGGLCLLVEIGNVRQQKRGMIMIARNGGNLRLAYGVDDFVGIGAIANQVATADNLIHFQAPEFLKNSLKCMVVAVNIG